MFLSSTHDQIAPDLARRSLFIRFSILSVYHYLSLSLFFFFLSSSELPQKIRSSMLLIPTLPKPWDQPTLLGVRVLLAVNTLETKIWVLGVPNWSVFASWCLQKKTELRNICMYIDKYGLRRCC